MTNPTPGRRVRHRYTCTRSAAICEGIRRDPTGRAYVVHVCAECRGDDYDTALLDGRHT